MNLPHLGGPLLWLPLLVSPLNGDQKHFYDQHRGGRKIGPGHSPLLQLGLGRELDQKGFWGHSRSEEDTVQLSRETCLQCCPRKQQISTLIDQCWGQAMQEKSRLETVSQEDFYEAKHIHSDPQGALASQGAQASCAWRTAWCGQSRRSPPIFFLQNCPQN